MKLELGYKRGARHYYGHPVGIPKPYKYGGASHPKIALMEKRLQEEGIDPEDYAFSVVGTWRGWFNCKAHGAIVPFGFLFNERALERYHEVGGERAVPLLSYNEGRRAELIAMERLVVSAWLDYGRRGEYRSLQSVVEEFADCLDPEWVKLWKSGQQRAWLVDQVLEEMCAMYCLPHQANYGSLMSALLRKGTLPSTPTKEASEPWSDLVNVVV